jgi:predicted N-formylglutamate amidohydrolase
MSEPISEPSGLSQLLGPNDPAPFRAREGRADSPFLIVVDHAGRVIPESLGRLGLSEAELSTHIAWDIGVEGVSELLAARLGAFMIAQTYSRLVIDCNRPLSAESSIVTLSEHTAIPGNRSVTPEQARARADAIFHPYHGRIERELARRQQSGQRTILISMHSFTPRFKGFDRPWHCGVLYHRDPRLALALLDLLRREGLDVGDNQPYFVSDDSDYAVPRYGEQLGNLHVELEIRQDLIAQRDQQERWGELLARVLPAAVAAMEPDAAL